MEQLSRIFSLFWVAEIFHNTLYLLIQTNILQKIAIWFPVLSLMVNWDNLPSIYHKGYCPLSLLGGCFFTAVIHLQRHFRLLVDNVQYLLLLIRSRAFSLSLLRETRERRKLTTRVRGVSRRSTLARVCVNLEMSFCMVLGCLPFCSIHWISYFRLIFF